MWILNIGLQGIEPRSLRYKQRALTNKQQSQKITYYVIWLDSLYQSLAQLSMILQEDI